MIKFLFLKVATAFTYASLEILTYVQFLIGTSLFKLDTLDLNLRIQLDHLFEVSSD